MKKIKKKLEMKKITVSDLKKTKAGCDCQPAPPTPTYVHTCYPCN